MIKNYLTGFRPAILLTLSIAGAGYAGAYPYLDPGHFDWRNGLIAFVGAATFFAVYHVGHTNNRTRIDNIESSLPDDRPTTRQRAVDGDNTWRG